MPFYCLLLTTLLLGLAPFVLYNRARALGTLPSEAEWAMRGGNHGPWWGTQTGDILGFCMGGLALLAIVSLLLGAVLSTSSKRSEPIVQAAILASTGFVLVFAQFLLLFWTID